MAGNATANGDVLVPNDLVPRWRDLPVLGWMATQRLGEPLTQLPILGPLACSATWPVTTTILVGDRAERTLAAIGKAAVLTVRGCAPARAPWLRLLASTAALPFAIAALSLPPVVLLGSAAVAEAAGWYTVGTALSAAAIVLLLTTAVLVLACVAQAVRSATPRQRRKARSLARRRGVRLVEASALAADTDHPRAATVLVRRLLRHADAVHTAVIANPRDARVVTMYRRLGFNPLDDCERMLVRWGRPVRRSSPP